ncbi:MAG: polysaccharide biosynthesis C-terminal domain-containing protein [Planctomycetota bacterium]
MLARNLATTAGSSVLAMPLSFAASVLLARWLGAEQRGILALAILIPDTVYLFATLGLSTTHLVFAGKYPEKHGAIAFQSLAQPVVAGVLVFALYGYLLGCRPAWFERFEVVGRGNHLLASFIVSFNLAYVNFQCAILGANRITAVNISNLLTPVARIVLTVTLIWWMKMGVTGGILSQLGCFAVLLIYLLIALATHVPVRTWKPDWAFMKKSVDFSLKVYPRFIAAFFLIRIGQYMIAYLLPNSDEALGHYALASQFALLIWVLPQSLQTVFLPHLSVTHANRAALSLRVTRMLFLALVPVLVLLTLGGPLIPLLAGRDYEASVAPFMWFLPGVLFFGATRPLDSYLTHVEKPFYGSIITAAGSVANVGLNLLLIPAMSISGAALALSLSYFLMSLLTVACFWHESRVSWRRLWVQSSDFADMLRPVRALVVRFRSRFA